MSQVAFEQSSPRMAILLPLLASIVAITPLALDLYLPGMLTIAKHFNTSIAIIQNSLSVYLAGYAMGLLLFGPMVDSIGRRGLALIGLFTFSICSFLLPLVETAQQFNMLRFLQAFCGSAATVVVPGVIRQFYGKDTAKGMSYVSMIMMLAPLIAPTLGSLVMYFVNWQAMFYFLSGYALLIFIGSYLKLPESKAKETGTRKNIDIIGSYKIVLGSKEARKYIITSMLVSLSFFAYLTAIPFVYLEIYQTSEFVFSFLFGINVVSLMMAQFFNSRYVSRLGSERILVVAFYLGVCAASVLVLVNILQMSLFWTVISILPLMGAISLIAVNSDSLILIAFANNTGTATAVIGTLRFGIGALAGPILTFFHNDTALPFTLLMFSALILIGIFQWQNIRKGL
ncbi:multidrug effflux MFS transporter [Thalassotalea sp. Y01]|uniref:multidrug effflux MFS transporter n=1 Tax=Thalassotalea sp. Y01 TaxID=2729613 RepID=UPI00145E64D4|nr:multidrug effflux MFS transporter [Thalassotalea sp. Y01]NMP17155.1 multidrug effflux MFS transporter [Thalassotalea sp. Y01]